MGSALGAGFDHGLGVEDAGEVFFGEVGELSGDFPDAAVTLRGFLGDLGGEVVADNRG